MMKVKSDKITCSICAGSDTKLLDNSLYSLYFCQVCKNGFVYPQPKNMEKYYPALYWQYQGIFSNLRKWLHRSFQKKRVSYFKGYLSKGEILDVGSGEGIFGKLLGSDFKVTNLEYPGAKIDSKDIIKADFLSWDPHQKFDGIVFLESLEHVNNPQEYLEKAAKLLKDGGYIFIEYPRFSCLESKLLGKYWMQRDSPRHLFHFTDRGIVKIAQGADLKTIAQKGILSYEYSPYCLLVSFMNILKVKPLNLRKGLAYNIPIFIFITILSPFTFVIETIFYFVNQSPIGLVVFKKKI